MSGEKRILYLDFCNFQDYPTGGYLTFAKNMITSFGNSLYLVGISTDKSDPIGKWFIKQINGYKFDFFALAYYSKNKTKHIIPDRLAAYFLTRYYKKRILEKNIVNIFIRRPEILISLNQSEDANVCFCFAGMENPLSISKYWYAKYFSAIFEQKLFNRLKTVSRILATGDDNAINAVVSRSHGLLIGEQIVKFPTRINTNIFQPMDRIHCRTLLGIPKNAVVVVSTGRLTWYKGWKFMIDSFQLFTQHMSDCLFYLIGDGEDFSNIKSYIDKLNLKNKVYLTGRLSSEEIAIFLNASDIFIMGSYKEGWSTALIEAIACGVPACVTNFSSASDIIVEGFNGYIIHDHQCELFVDGMHKTLKIAKPIQNEAVLSYSTTNLKNEILKSWTLI